MTTQRKYYDPGSVLSKQRFMNFVISARGYGKTYGFKRHIIRKCIEQGGSFVYLRRTQKQIDRLRNFFGSLQQDEYFKDKYRFLQRGTNLYYVEEKMITEDEKIPWIFFGRLLSVSTFNSAKSEEYDDVKFVLFDEALQEKGANYLPNEVNKFLNLIDTIVRNRDDVTVVLLSNAVSLYNIYFEAFGVRPNPQFEFTYGEDLVVQICPSHTWAEERAKTRFGNFISNIKDKSYKEYALNNSFQDDDDSFIEKRDSKSFNIAIFEIDGRLVGVWYSPLTGKLFFDTKFNNTTKTKIKVKFDASDETYASLKTLSESKVYEKIIEARSQNLIRFTNKKAKSIALQLLTTINLI